MKQATITGSGLWRPQGILTNEELVLSYNKFAAAFNETHQEAIKEGRMKPKPSSSVSFIEKASGIKQRYVYVKEGVTDINRMRPAIPVREDDQLSDQAEMAVAAARAAMKDAGRRPSDIDAVIVACAYTQRSYPAIAIEVQEALGIRGFGFDMLVACSSATFALHRATEMILADSAQAVLVINPELTSPQINYKDRDSHFIFGDVATALVVEGSDSMQPLKGFRILSRKAETIYSNHIRSNFGYLLPANDRRADEEDQLFRQNGRSVFKEVCPLAARHLLDHLASSGYDLESVKRWWLHQANINMNRLIARLMLGREPSMEEAPIILDQFANTASAGSIIAFHLHNSDLKSGDLGVLASFGAGYSIGSLILEKMAS